MANTFEGKPDARQAPDPKPGQPGITPSRFRPRYRALTEAEMLLHGQLKEKASELEALFLQVNPGRYNSLAVTALEQSIMWIVKELTS